MRLILLNIILFLGFGLSAQRMASVSSEKSIKEGLSSGMLTFTFPEDLGKDEINKVASYYEQYFTVLFNEESHQINVKMIQNDSRSRLVVTRFLTANGIDKIVVGAREMTIDEFNSTYLK